MNKAIFIIDMPKCCGECPMSGTGVCRKWSMKEARSFPKDCPLKNADEIKEEFELMDIHYDNDYFSSNNKPMFLKKEVLEVIEKYIGIKFE